MQIICAQVGERDWDLVYVRNEEKVSDALLKMRKSLSPFRRRTIQKKAKNHINSPL